MRTFKLLIGFVSSTMGVTVNARPMIRRRPPERVILNGPNIDLTELNRNRDPLDFFLPFRPETPGERIG